jgi:hypothetical protein
MFVVVRDSARPHENRASALAEVRVAAQRDVVAASVGEAAALAAEVFAQQFAPCHVLTQTMTRSDRHRGQGGGGAAQLLRGARLVAPPPRRATVA